MARGGKPETTRGLPPPLPPEQRTVGQLVGEAIRLYGANFPKALALGVPVVAVNALVWSVPSASGRLLVAPVSAVLIPLSYVAAAALVTRTPLRARRALRAYVVGVLVFIPFPFLAALFVLPGLVWLALFGLAVPAVLAEDVGLRAGLARGLSLARADFVHVLGGLATLALVVFLTQAGLYFVLREYAENTQRAAAVLASLLVSPLVFLGAALLYVDQEARLGSRPERGKERDAHVPDAHDTHREGRSDPPRQPGPAA
jgi:hypothetical protein